MATKSVNSLKILLTVSFIAGFLFIIIPVKKAPAITGDSQEVWSHQNNKIEIAQENAKKFQGIEIDLVYDNRINALNVRHDIESAVTDINLSDVIQATYSTQCKYWLDIKNLSSTNVEKVLKELELISTTFPSFKNRTIIESHQPKELSLLGQNGFYTSYWVPHYEDKVISYFKFFIRTKPVLLRREFNALSAHKSMLSFLKLFYPRHNFHIWTHDFAKEELIPATKELLINHQVKVLLIDYSSPEIIRHTND
jgi:uncharacterized protein YqfB (UPF0267 family)